MASPLNKIVIQLQHQYRRNSIKDIRRRSVDFATSYNIYTTNTGMNLRSNDKSATNEILPYTNQNFLSVSHMRSKIFFNNYP